MVATFTSIYIHTALQALAQTYAPRVWLAQDEPYFPSSVEYFFSNTNLEGQTYAPSLTRMPDDGRLVSKEGLSSASSDLGFFAGERNLLQAPVYALVADRGNGYLDMVYWTFYPYNRGKRVCIGYYADNECIGAVVWGHCVGHRVSGCIGEY